MIKARNEKARKKKVHKSQEITTFYGSESRQHVFSRVTSHMNINPKGIKFIIDVDLVNKLIKYTPRKKLKYARINYYYYFTCINE